MSAYSPAPFYNLSRILWRAGGALLLAVLLCGIFTWMPVSAHTYAGGTGRVYGKLLNGTTKQPMAGQTVTLQIAQGDSSKDAQTAVTDAGGNYNFPNLSNDKTLTFAVYIKYQNANYSTDRLSLVNQSQQQADLTVYDATSDSSKMAVIESTVLVQGVDAKRNVLSVSEIFAFKNLDGRAFVGSLDASQGRPKALFFPLPAGARAISLKKGFDGYRAIQAANGFASDAAVLPGDSEFSFNFEVPYSGNSLNFDYKAMYPTLDISFMVPTQMHVSSADATPKGVINNADHPYNLYNATNLVKDRQLLFKVEGLPQATESLSNTKNSGFSIASLNNLWLIVGIIVLLAVVILAWNIIRVVRIKLGLEEDTRKPAKSKGSAKGKQAKRAEEEEEDSRDKKEKALLKELLELDKAYDAKEISKSTYEEKRNKTKARLRTIMREREAASR
ncbi:hypothetical protein KSX_18650 [Ktedonospora formicarum]|uniref:Carboxypeptidase regulatory-like domain-containing protein n=2 Tax=Ktedonospora formicarum TaxID=2778364 RepID=A0A8J3HZW8_9CHLR|nr:hypothetical protein KSX_18650 [Ktedonospora formicarum]